MNEWIHTHQNNGGVVTLDEHLTKQQLQDYQKELKKLGVDFSVVQRLIFVKSFRNISYKNRTLVLIYT
ncbi:hypothetical protein [Bacillus toyonensis]|nr:hypothetical protein [Bacillus toyonensis]